MSIKYLAMRLVRVVQDESIKIVVADKPQKQNAVDDYLEFCRDVGKQPDIPELVAEYA